MLLKQIVKYIIKSDRDKINADIMGYKTLRNTCRAHKMIKEDAYTKISSFLDENNQGQFGCKMFMYTVSSAWDPKWIVKGCEHFDGKSVCTNQECPYINANREYFKTLDQYNASRQRCRQYWPMKFARMK